MNNMSDKPCINTDRELYRETEGDYYSSSLHVTEKGKIGIDVGGTVVVLSLREWMKRALFYESFKAIVREVNKDV